MINNIWFKITTRKINKIPEFYTIFCMNNAQLHNKTTRSRPGRGQNLEAEAKILASRGWVSSVLRPHQHSIGYTGDGFYRGHFGLKDLTSLLSTQYTVTLLAVRCNTVCILWLWNSIESVLPYATR